MMEAEAQPPIQSYPPRVRAALSRLIDALAPLAPEPKALVVYGSLAKGTYREGESDVNLAVVLGVVTPALLRALSGPLRAAHREVRLAPFIVEAREIPRLADVFPVKLLDIRSARHVLAGDDPFSAVTVEREHLRLRVEQELRNHLLRLRRRAIFAGDDARVLASAIYGLATSIAVELAALLELRGRTLPPGASMRAITRAAADAFELDRELLQRLADIKEGAPIDDAPALLLRGLELLERAVEVADTMGPER
jgi:predicted nucleotidyltransferase